MVSWQKRPIFGNKFCSQTFTDSWVHKWAGSTLGTLTQAEALRFLWERFILKRWTTWKRHLHCTLYTHSFHFERTRIWFNIFNIYCGSIWQTMTKALSISTRQCHTRCKYFSAILQIDLQLWGRRTFGPDLFLSAISFVREGRSKCFHVSFCTGKVKVKSW